MRCRSDRCWCRCGWGGRCKRCRGCGWWWCWCWWWYRYYIWFPSFLLSDFSIIVDMMMSSLSCVWWRRHDRTWITWLLEWVTDTQSRLSRERPNSGELTEAKKTKLSKPIFNSLCPNNWVWRFGHQTKCAKWFQEWTQEWSTTLMVYWWFYTLQWQK